LDQNAIGIAEGRLSVAVQQREDVRHFDAPAW
jgi:hypothetical protein